MSSWNEKIAECTRQIQQNPNDYMAYYNRGKIFRDLAYEGRGNIDLAYEDFNEYDENAIQDFTQAIKLNPNYADAYFYRGCDYSCLGQYERAIQDFTQAIQLHPNYGSAYYNRGKIYSKLGRKKQADQDFDMHIKLSVMDNRGLITDFR